MVRENILKIQERIRSACIKAKCDLSSVTIVAVSKGRTVTQIVEAIRAGMSDIGENRVQEALLKYKELLTMNHEPLTIKWHMVGHLQTNKVREAVKIFDLIHSVDSLRLAREINKQAAKINKIQDILIEVKTSGEATKFGATPSQTPGLVKEICALKNISLRGLMTIAPLVDNPEKARPYFKTLRELKDRVNHELRTMNYELNILSMGMTDDFEVAIEEGANMVRIGRAIFDVSS
ncbi:MAG: YggS family pyridoxal phosphate-dependent enzyme [Candidatus Omnitrophota bacterium]